MRCTITSIETAGPPPIQGLVFRRFRGEADYPAMVSLLNACAQADGLDYAESVENLRHLFTHLIRCDPFRDMLFAEVDGRTIAYTRVWWREEGTGDLVFLCHGFVHPAWRRKGLGRTLLHSNERRLREIAREHSGEHKSLQVWAADGEAGAHVLYAHEGYRPARFLVEMVRPIDLPLPPAPLPSGLAVRSVQAGHLRAIWQARDEAYRDHWGYSPPTEKDYRRWTESALFNPALWKVAWADDQVAGMVLNRIDEQENAKNRRKRGYTQDIFVRRPWRRRGLARALLTQSIEMFRAQGMEETALSADVQNPYQALALYRSTGYHEVRRITVYRKPLESGAR